MQAVASAALRSEAFTEVIERAADADAVAAALDLALLLEGSDLEEVSDAEEAVRLVGGDAAALTPPLVDRIIDHLRELAGRASEAAEELAAHRRT